MKKLAFLLYDARSGSTVLSAYLNRHKAVCVAQESGFAHIVLEYPHDSVDARTLPGLLDRLYREKQFCEMGISRATIEQRLSARAFPLGKKQIIDEIRDIYFPPRDASAEVHVLKCPRIVFHLGTIVDLYPDVRFIHLVRDGRAVFSSKRQSRSIKGTAMERNLLKAATDWRRRQRVSRRHTEHVTALRYEDFLADPDGSIDLVLTHLDIDESGREVTKPVSSYSESIGGSQKHLHTNVGQGLDASRVDRWKDELKAADVLAYEWLNRKELTRYGYPMLYADKSPGTALRLASAGRLIGSVFHYIASRTRNLYYLLFVRKSLWQRLVAKSYEYK